MIEEKDPVEIANTVLRNLRKRLSADALRTSPNGKHTSFDESGLYSSEELAALYLGDIGLLNSAIEELFLKKLTAIFEISSKDLRDSEFKKLLEVMPLKAIGNPSYANLCISAELVGELGLVRIDKAMKDASSVKDLSKKTGEESTRINTLFSKYLIPQLNEYVKMNKLSDTQTKLLLLRYQFRAGSPEMNYYSSAAIKGDKIVDPLFEAHEKMKKDFENLRSEGWKTRLEIVELIKQENPECPASVNVVGNRADHISTSARENDKGLTEEDFSKLTTEPKTNKTMRLISPLCQYGDKERGIGSIIHYESAKQPEAAAATPSKKSPQKLANDKRTLDKLVSSIETKRAKAL